ncbi:MAG: glycerol kinase GlpK [Pseudomonadota bacterium]
MKYLLALDQGTTSSRSIIFTLDGKIVNVSQIDITQHFPDDGWVEHDPEEIFKTQLATARDVIEKADISPSDIGAIGITNQRETTIIWDRNTGKPLHRAIVWQDRRTAAFTERLRVEGVQPLIRRKTGLVCDPYFSASKIAWILDQTPGLRSRASGGEVCFGTVDSWLLYRLSGGKVHATDVTNAGRTLLFDINTLDWDDELLEIFDVPRSILPEVHPSAGFFTRTEAGLLGESLPVTGVAGDQQAALFGQACFDPGMAKNTYGTGAFVVMNTGDAPVIGEGVLATPAWRIGENPVVYALEGSIFIAGAAVQWLRDGLGIIETSPEVESLASSVADNGGVYFVPALVGLGAPHWDPYARGLIAGVTRSTTRAHLARAALESMTFQTMDAVRVMQDVSNISLKELRVDGGAAANSLLLQIQADILGAPVLRPVVTETTALGAALLAGVGAGLMDLEDARESWVLDGRWEPVWSREERQRQMRSWERAVARAKGWLEPEND